MTPVKRLTGITIAAAAGGMFMTVGVGSAVAGEGKIHCEGVNSCKSQNPCKGKGFLAITGKECMPAGGKKG